MATETQANSAFTEWYRDRIGEPTTADEARGYWVFAIGVILGLFGMLLLITSDLTTRAPLAPIVISAVALSLLIAGPLIRLPLRRRANQLVYVGAVLSLLAVPWFASVYPGSDWRAAASSIIGLYALGMLVMALGGVFVPLLRSGRKYEEEIDELEGELEELRRALDDAEADEEELSRLIDQLRQDQADTAADETDLAARLRTLRESQARFEHFEDAAGEYRWRLLHRNGNIIADSGEGYTRRHDARRAVDRIRERVDELEFQVFEDAAGEYRWRLLAGNDEIVADSGEGYTDRDEAEKAVERVRDYAPDADALDIGQAAFEVYEDAAGEWRWRLRHRNGNIVADGGEGYASRSGAIEGIESVKRNAPNAEREEV